MKSDTGVLMSQTSSWWKDYKKLIEGRIPKSVRVCLVTATEPYDNAMYHVVDTLLETFIHDHGQKRKSVWL